MEMNGDKPVTRNELKAELNVTKKELRDEMGQMRDGLRSEMGEMRDGLRSEMGEMRDGLRSEMGQMREELRGEMSQMKTELKGDIAHLDTKVDRLEGTVKRLAMDQVNMRAEMATKTDIYRMENTIHGYQDAVLKFIEGAQAQESKIHVHWGAINQHETTLKDHEGRIRRLEPGT